jgi:hypothetical protein
VWFAVGMVVEFGVIDAWFYAPQGTLYASLFPTRIRYTGLPVRCPESMRRISHR